jgi:signal transduction histidine kinase
MQKALTNLLSNAIQASPDGLAVARRIFTLHGGTITATNHPEGGAVFHLKIPLE